MSSEYIIKNFQNIKPNMKYIVTLVFILTGVSSAYSQKKCSDFKVGSFIYSKPEFQRFKVSRNETTQIEIDSITGTILEASIVWKSECEYELTYTKISDERGFGMIGQKLTVNILKISGNDIIVTSEGAGIKLELEMTKLESN